MNQPPHSDLHESNRVFYDRISKAYDLMSDASERPARMAGLDLLGLKPGARVLEVGCGTGNMILELAQRVGPTGTVSGIDISFGMLDVAREKLQKVVPGTPIDLRLADARQLPFADHEFDAAYVSFTLELFPEEDLPLVLGELRRILRPGGALGVVSMARVKPGEEASMIEKSYIWFHRHFPHIVDCRPIDLVKVLTSEGFRVTRQINLEIWTMPVAAVTAV